MSTVKGIPHDSIYLEFPAGRSDGNPSKWPTDKLDSTPDANGEVNFMRPVELTEPLSIKWRIQVGREVAKLLGHTNHTKYVLKDFPEGYKFYHHNKGSMHDPRTDPYLYGSASGRFRSPPEFVRHAFWLITDDTLDRSNCGCKYCASSKSQKQISQELGISSAGPAPGPSATRMKPKVRLVAQPRKPLARSVVSHDRTADMRSARRFRAGELVWCALSSPIYGSHPDECIEFWPGLVNETRLKSEVMPHAPGEKWRVVQSTIYKVKLLAVMHSYVLPESAMLPYQAYCPSVKLIEPLRKAGDPTRLQDLNELAHFNPVLLGAESIGSSQLRFVEASTPFALAIQVAAHLVRLWTPSDEWTFHGETTLKRAGLQFADVPTTVDITETRHQGLWWGAERIWVDELVRLQPGRSQVVPQGSEVVSRASPRADGRGVLMRINSILAEPRGVSKDVARECKVSGVLYELAEETYEETAETATPLDATPLYPADNPTTPIPTKNSAVSSADELFTPEGGTDPPPLPSTSQNDSVSRNPSSSPINLPTFPPYPLPEAPSGYKFRPITKPGYEIVLDVSLVAGRYYPGLLKHPLLQDALADVDVNESRVAQLNALCGLLAGSINSMECMDWVGTRLAMVKLADMKAQQDLHQHWHSSSPVEENQGDVSMDPVNERTEPSDIVMETST